MLASELKSAACGEIDRVASELIAASDHIGRNPELGLQEFKTSALLCQILEKHWIAVEKGTAGMPTAFKAEIRGRAHRPRVAILAEYDALPEVGHGCGHNIIATAAIGAGIGLAKIASGLSGSVVVLGTPAEESAVENAGGKIPMVQSGVFDDVDAAIMIHPSTENGAFPLSSLAARSFEFQFTGRPAHAAAMPEKGINALDGVLITFAGVNALRQHVRSDVRIHGIITHGGTSPNVVPAYAACRFRMRAEDASYLEEVVRKVIKCAEAGAVASGATLQYREYVHPYHDMIPSRVLSEVASANMEALAITVLREPRRRSSGSTDLGNVSHKVPAVTIRLAIADEEVAGHSKEFAEAALSPRGQVAVISGAKALATTALDVLCKANLVDVAWQEHTETISARSKQDPA